MKNSKIFRWLCALLSVVFLFSLVSCSNDGDDGEANTSPIVYNVDYVYTGESSNILSSTKTKTTVFIRFFENGQVRLTKLREKYLNDQWSEEYTTYGHGWYIICSEGENDNEKTYIRMIIVSFSQSTENVYQYGIYLDISEDGKLLEEWGNVLPGDKFYLVEE